MCEFYAISSPPHAVPSDAFSVALTGNQSQPALEGESFSITCCYTIHTTGLLSVPTLEWYRGSGKINSEVTTEYSVISNNQCSILNILNVQKAYEDDTYTCKGILHSSLLQNGNLSVYTMLNITKAKSDSKFVTAMIGFNVRVLQALHIP